MVESHSLSPMFSIMVMVSSATKATSLVECTPGGARPDTESMECQTRAPTASGSHARKQPTEQSLSIALATHSVSDFANYKTSPSGFITKQNVQFAKTFINTNNVLRSIFSLIVFFFAIKISHKFNICHF